MFDPFIFVLVFGSILLGVQGERWRVRWSRNGGRLRGARHNWRGGRVVAFKAPAVPEAITDAADQLRIVCEAVFDKRRILNKAETRVLQAAEAAIRAADLPWRVMAQVSLGEVLTTPDRRAYGTINSKRVDLLVVTRLGDPVAAIEYQGSGHYQGNAPARDAVKREALRRAGVRYIELTPEHGPDDLAAEFSRIANVQQLKALG